MHSTQAISEVGGSIQPSNNRPRGDHYSYLYAKIPKNGHFRQLPEISGMKCVGVAAYDLFAEKDAAFSLLAEIATGRIGGFEAESVASKFLEVRGYGEATVRTLIQ